MYDKNNDGISPRLHQLVRVGPDGRPEVVGRIGKIIQFTKFIMHYNKVIMGHEFDSIVYVLCHQILVGDDEMDVIEGNGFLNMAMHTLVQDKQKNSIGYPIQENRPLTATGGKLNSIGIKASL